MAVVLTLHHHGRPPFKKDAITNGGYRRMRRSNGRTLIFVAHGRERTFDYVGRAQMLPLFGRKVVEGQQRIAILDQTIDRSIVLDAPGFDEGIKCDECILLGLGHPDLLQRLLGSASAILIRTLSMLIQVARPFQSPKPGLGEKYWNLSAFPSHSFQSGGGAFLARFLRILHSATAIS